LKLPSKSRLVSPVNCCRAGASAAAIFVSTAMYVSLLQAQQDTAHSCSSLHLAAARVHRAHSQRLQACQTLQDRSKQGCICRVTLDCIQGKALQAGEAAEGGAADAATLQASR
jgi:hypothetical protein